MTYSKTKISDLLSALAKSGFKGDIEADHALRAAMSTDNSIYQIMPDLIVAPRSGDDVVVLLGVLEQEQFLDICVTGRGAGTGTNGQSLNRGIVVDMRRYMNSLIDADLTEGWADVEPGMVLDDLNAQLRSSGWFFAPETSTSTRCTIGGMVSTDASGKGSRIYGKTSDNLLGLEIASPYGLLNSFDAHPEWAENMLRGAKSAARSGRGAFVAHMPKLNRRFTGYDLERACPSEGAFEWWRLFPGSEGTLGLITKIRVRLRPIETEKRLLVVGFNSFDKALSCATPLGKADPTAMEVMDDYVQNIAKEAGILDQLPATLRPEKGQNMSYVFVEVNGNSKVVIDEKLYNCQKIVESLSGVVASYVSSELSEIRSLWSIRSAAVGLLGRVDGLRRPVAFVEDCVVPVENLPRFVAEFREILRHYDLKFGIYGHADVGCLHIRPALNIDDDQDVKILKSVSDQVFQLVKKYDGIFWGEHGKGVRGAYLKDWAGPEIYQALQGVKAAFDPQNRFNPGKLVSPNHQLMGVATTPFRAFNTNDSDKLKGAFRCNGNAQCLSYEKSTAMCPSFKASADVRHSPKGRADALRYWHEAVRDDHPDIDKIEADILPAMESCLGCKACSSQCPVQVDIPSMRSAFYAAYYRKNRRSLSDQLILLLERMSPYLTYSAPFLSKVWPLASHLGAAITGYVDLPKAIARRDRNLVVTAEDINKPLPQNAILLVQDWFTAIFDPDLQDQAIAGFKALGFHPRFLEMKPAGKAAHLLGDFDQFHKMADALSKHLNNAAESGAPLVALDPAFRSMLMQEYQKADVKLPRILSPQRFLVERIEAGLRLPDIQTSKVATLLSHCTEMSADPNSNREWCEVFRAIGVDLKTPKTGCCGMAGMFGHKAQNQKVSRDLFDLSWREHFDQSKDIVATGFSCRCQSSRLSIQTPVHPLGLIADILTSRS